MGGAGAKPRHGKKPDLRSLIPTIRDLNGLLIEWSSGNAKSSSFFKELKRDINDFWY
jgi:hypothetical protein